MEKLYTPRAASRNIDTASLVSELAVVISERASLKTKHAVEMRAVNLKINALKARYFRATGQVYQPEEAPDDDARDEFGNPI